MYLKLSKWRWFAQIEPFSASGVFTERWLTYIKRKWGVEIHNSQLILVKQPAAIVTFIINKCRHKVNFMLSKNMTAAQVKLNCKEASVLLTFKTNILMLFAAAQVRDKWCLILFLHSLACRSCLNSLKRTVTVWQCEPSYLKNPVYSCSIRLQIHSSDQIPLS